MGDDSTEPTLHSVGEFAVIDRLVRDRTQTAGVAVGPGDDAAVLGAPDGHVAVTTDMLVEGSHFRLDWSTPHEVGRKAIAQNASDIESMGARVTGYVVAFGAPGDTAAGRVAELADGMWAEAAKTGAGIVGGDLVASPHWVVSVTALGDLGGRQPVLRSGARAGSVIAVAGELGRSAAGLALLRNGIGQPGDGFDDLRAYHRVPRPPYGQGRAAAEAGAQAMTDVSDGLLADLGHLAVASGVVMDLRGAALREDVDAVATAARAAGLDPWSLVLAGGEDHALVACFPDYPPHGWRVIGAVCSGDPAVLLDGQPWTGSAGWQSYD
ncbi:MAG: thiamine-phosphate kinase [Mycobacterium sp.]|nr:thiamine-phosphate kinase [Mycobacterium sp.]